MVLTCRICHRVKIDSRWEQYGGVQADVVGICPTCLGWQTRVAAAKGRERDRKAENGPGEGDPFRGFRG